MHQIQALREALWTENSAVLQEAVKAAGAWSPYYGIELISEEGLKMAVATFLAVAEKKREWPKYPKSALAWAAKNRFREDLSRERKKRDKAQRASPMARAIAQALRLPEPPEAPDFNKTMDALEALK